MSNKNTLGDYRSNSALHKYIDAELERMTAKVPQTVDSNFVKISLMVMSLFFGVVTILIILDALK